MTSLHRTVFRPGKGTDDRRKVATLGLMAYKPIQDVCKDLVPLRLT